MNKPLILLYNPKKDAGGEVNSLPLSLLSISAVLDPDKVDIKILEGALIRDLNTELSKYADKNLLLAGVTAITGPPLYDALTFAKAFKKMAPNVPVVWGGTHPTILPVDTLEDPHADFIVKGQGEIPFKMLVECLLNDTSPKDIPGLTMKIDGETIDNPMDKPVNINEFPEYPWHLVDISKYVIPMEGVGLGGKGIVYVTSQGCPFVCSFCSDIVLYNRTWTAWPAERVINDIKMLSQYDIDGIMFFDNNFFVNAKRVLELCDRMLEEKIELVWYADIRIDQINKYTQEDLELIKRAGGTTFLVGAESGDQSMLDLVQKNIGPEDILEAAKKCKKAGIGIVYSFMTGFPEVYREEFAATLTLIEQLRQLDDNTRIILCAYAPYPGTELFETHKDIIVTPENLEGWGNYTVLNVNTSWMDKEHADIVKSWSTFYMDCAFSNQNSWYSIKMAGKKNIFIKLGHKFFQNLAIYRLQNQYFKFRWEEKLVNGVLKFRRYLKKHIAQRRKNLAGSDIDSNLAEEPVRRSTLSDMYNQNISGSSSIDIELGKQIGAKCADEKIPVEEHV